MNIKNKSYMQNKTSNFWLDDSPDIDVLTGEEISTGKDYHKIASTLRAISNFVNIVTGQSIPVTYSTKDESYTDGEAVVLSSNIKDKDFDPTVGLALHEGSHIKLTDFSTLKNLMDGTFIPRDIKELVIQKYYSDKDEVDQNWMAENYIQVYVKDLLNIVEDRRIDNFIYTTAPGYRGYYQAMYNKYFNSKIIDKGLQSDDKRTEDWDSYFFRICNITNQNRDLKALKALPKIWKALDLKNISRLKTTDDALKVAFEIFKLVEEQIEVVSEPEAKQQGGGEEEQDGETKTGTKRGSGGSPTSGNGTQLSRKQKHQLQKQIKKQKDFTAGKTKKSTMSKGDKKKVKSLQNSGSTMVKVGNGVRQNWGTPDGNGTDCIVVKTITKELIDSCVYNTLTNYSYAMTKESVILDGLRLGTQLGKKLQVRNDERSLKYNRLRKGNIDKRMISSLGFGNEQVFEQIFIDKFKPVNLHISIDASGSMSGQKWSKSQTSAIAIAKAASMVQNLNVVISYRSSESVTNKELPAIFIAYDSKKDKISKIKKIFPHICSPGITPEGLCFEAIQNLITPGTSDTDSYFINFSDGEPYFVNKDIEYYGDDATLHTKKQVENMKAKGVKILSYFISSNYSTNMERFKRMYGIDSQNINTDQLTQLAKSLNKRFATK